MVYTHDMTIEQRLEIIRQTIKEGWSTHMTLRKGRVTRKEMAMFREPKNIIKHDTILVGPE